LAPLRELLFVVAERRSPLLESEEFVHAFAALAKRRRQWLRDAGEWAPRSHNVSRQFASLLRHLLAKYDVPHFFDSAWKAYGCNKQKAWFIHIATGNNLRTASGLPFPLTKMMAHHAMGAPDDLNVFQALRWGQVRALGGTERLARAIVNTRLRCPMVDEPFWLTVVQFFVGSPMLDPSQIGPIVDYLQAQRFETAPDHIENGRLQAGTIPQPGLSMKGRTVETLLRQVQAWHRTLNRAVAPKFLAWEPSLVKGYERVEGTPGNQRLFRITELLNSDELLREGRAMHHCVASYAHSCARRACAIFSLVEDQGSGVERRLTIEVTIGTRRIVQARGRFNSMPNAVDERILRAWATTAGLNFPNAGHRV
jgi:hypothetical protein